MLYFCFFNIKEIQLNTLQRENANLEVGDVAIISRIKSVIVSASKIVLKPLGKIDFPIDQMLNIFAKEILSRFGTYFHNLIL